MERYFVGKANSTEVEHGWVYVHSEGEVEFDNKISVKEYHEIQRMGNGIFGSIVSKDDLIEITQEEFRDFETLWIEWGTGEIEEETLNKCVDDLLKKYGAA